jgi:hypothetical protein
LNALAATEQPGTYRVTQRPSGPIWTHVPEDEEVDGEEDGEGDGEGLPGSGLGDPDVTGEGVGSWPSESDGSGVGQLMVDGPGEGRAPAAGWRPPGSALPPGELAGAPDRRPSRDLTVLPDLDNAWLGARPLGPMFAACGWRGAIVSVTNDIRMKTIAVDTSKISGGSSRTG